MTTDFTVRGEGTIYLLTPNSDAARAWRDEYLPEDAMTLGPAVAVEHRYIDDIISGILQDGLTVILDN